MANTFIDLLIHVRAYDQEQQCYPVEAELSDGSHFADGGLIVDQARLTELETDPQAYGLALFDALFTGPIRRAYDIATGQAQVRTGGRVHLRLWLEQKAGDLHALVWERLHAVRQGNVVPLAASADTPLSRYVDLDRPEPEPLAQRPVRMLYAVANPTNLTAARLAPLDVEAEVMALLEAVEPLLRAGQLQLTVLPGQTGLSDALRARLAAADVHVETGTTDADTLLRLLSEANGYHILHFLGHGGFSQREQAATLVLENTAGEMERLRDRELAKRLQALPTLPRLVVLAACESARRTPESRNPFVGLAPRLVAAGIPAIVAMQDTVPLATARELTRDFYRYLLEHGHVGLALNQARLLLYEGGQRDWAVPVLLTRLRTGQLLTPDPLRQTLATLAAAELFNPLPPGEPYLPLEVLHLRGKMMTVNLETLAQERTATRELTETLNEILTSADQREGPTLVALVGPAETGKAFQLRHYAQLIAQQSLAPGATPATIPVYVDFQALAIEPWGSADPIQTLLQAALQPFWPGLTDELMHTLMEAETGPRLLLILDGAEALPPPRRRRLWEALRTFQRRLPRHPVLIAFDSVAFDPNQLAPTDLLLVQPLSPQTIERFLTQQVSDPAGTALYAALVQAQLFDLAALPWVLINMLAHARQGDLPRSHAQVLRTLVDETVLTVTPEQGMRARATRTLYTLAWQMQSTGQRKLRMEEAFRLMATAQGGRGYPLEAFYQELVRCGLLEPVGEEALRFARPSIQTYCCAQAILNHEERDRILDEITATLGRPSRYQWWEETLVLLAGLLPAPTVLLRKLIYGTTLGEGETVFLAARCIQESRNTPALRPVEDRLVNHVVSALLWRLDSSREPNVTRRVRAAEALGQLGATVAIPHLVKIASQKVRLTPLGERKYETASVRLAAALALRRLAAPPFAEIRPLAEQLATVLNLWAEQQVEALVPYLLLPGRQDENTQAIAAFALADLKTERAQEMLFRVFLTPRFSLEAQRNIGTALTLLDPAVVTQRAILPLLDESRRAGLPPGAWEQRTRWYGQLAYMIGRLRIQEPTARAFLDRCLDELPQVELKATAIQSLGWLYDFRSKGRLESIALGDFSSLALATLPSPDEQQLLQLKALEALYYLGDLGTLKRLQERPPDWSLELESALYRTSEEIMARQ